MELKWQGGGKIFSQTAGALIGTGNFVQFLPMDVNHGDAEFSQIQSSPSKLLLVSFTLHFSTNLKMK